MPIKLSWHPDHPHTILMHYSDPWTLDEQRTAFYKISRMVISRSPQTVTTLVDMRSSHYMPGQLMLNAQAADGCIHVNSGPIVIVGAAPAFIALYRASQRFMPKTVQRLQFVKTLQEAEWTLRGETYSA
ncbi:MAG: hypothetical protein AAF787_03230 [Chloroflexota bacterium]